ncbi:DUF4148 domain-containing protein [Paraburkholderia phytofirmans]|uniref:DUF4148 domain-containing protein n=1 Tax=Paraburkholderia sp. BL9I2N2 TaxID=1938809 RepID=UPI00105190C1|nr:DUF4148 domain-containing protein [Paraburkholderia sp. BL9I2N2]TCK95913.1 uncharacterized protein DUF4148 [Paraburkholderia sp. BL9I2N2]
MRKAKWFAGVVLGFAWMSVSVASDGVSSLDPATGPRVAYEAQEQVQQKPQQVQGGEERAVRKARQAPQGKTREEVKRELAVARAAGCMDVSDSQYPQPCPLPDGARSVADAFQMR